MPASVTQSSSRASASSSSRKRRRTGSRSARSSTCEAVSRCGASSSSRETTPSTGLVWRSERSASRTRRSGRWSRGRSSSSNSPAPNVAWISGANVSMSGHITITSRGSSVGSASSRCRIASRTTSTWRARPWHAWTSMLPSAAPGSGGRSSRTAAWTRASIVPAAGSHGVLVAGDVRPEDELELAHVLPPGGQQAVAGQPRRRVLRAAADARRQRLDPLPQRGRRMQEEEVHVAVLGQRAQDLELAGGQAREAEQREPLRQLGEPRLGPQARAGARHPGHRIGRFDARDEPLPQLALPVIAGQELGAVQRVAVEEPREMAHGREPARRLVRQVRLQPGLVARLADQVQQRPHQPLRQPRVGVRVDPRRRRHRVARQLARERELDVGADPEPQRQPLRQPALHPARGHADQLGRERVGRRVGEQGAQGLDEAVGAIGSVDVEHGVRS